MSAPAASNPDAAAPKGCPLFVKLANIDDVDYATQVILNAKGMNRKAWDEKGEKHFILRDPLANYKEGMDAPPPVPPPMEIDEDAPDYFVAFPRQKMCEMSEHVKRQMEVQETNQSFMPIPIAEMSPEALELIAEFFKNHSTEKLRDIPKPMRDHVKSYLSDTDKAWVAKFINFDNVYDNWTLFRMVDSAEVLMYEDLSTVVAAVLGECLKDKKVSELRKFFHETDAHGGFGADEEKALMKQCRESWPESKHLFDVGMDEAEAADAGKKA